MTQLEIKARKISNELLLMRGAEREAYITSAIADAERRVWLEAAQHAATDACAMSRGAECQRLSAYFRLRAQAQADKEE